MGWFYKQPVKIIFGCDQVKSIGQFFAEQGFENGLLVSDPVFCENGLADKILTFADGHLREVFSEITPNPTLVSVDRCADLIRKKNYKFVVALGGGSSLDCAKAACSVCKTEDSVVDYYQGKKKFTGASIPLIAIPTTAGTGSEVTPVAVLSDPAENTKAPIVSDNFYPQYAIVDPVLTLTVPPQVTAATGMDVLAHALEAFWSKNHLPICDALALKAAATVLSYLLVAYRDGENLEARTKMSEASLLAGLAFGLPKTTGPHACSFPLTSLYQMPHGEACAFTLDKFTRINAEAEGGRLHKFAQDLGFTDAYALADRILELKKAMRMKVTLEDADIKEEDLPELARASQHPNMENNPVPMDYEKILELYRSLS